MTLMRFVGETLAQYQARTGLDHWATEAEMRAENQRYIRNYCRANNPPEVVARLEQEWKRLDGR